MSACEWMSLRSALAHFVEFRGATQSQEHIKPLHWYVACRLVVEGGFNPDEVMPRPPFRVGKRKRKGRAVLVYEPGSGGTGERTVYGGLKTKDVDVVVTKEGIGPVLAVSCRGSIGAFRNLTNRMEEAVGDCTNLHIASPPLVYGYLVVLRANRAEEVGGVPEQQESEQEQSSRRLANNDVAIDRQGRAVAPVRRYHAALRELANRRGVRNDLSRYEAIALALASTRPGQTGRIVEEFPEADSPLRFERFFDTLYRQYDERFVYGAPDLRKVTARKEWASASAAFSATQMTDVDYEPRINGS